MTDKTNADRQRRHRKHKAGDHSLCDPRRCDDAVTPVVTRPAERRLGPRGRRLWEEEGGDELTGVRRNVLEEACRLVDRLDRLDAILNGRDRAWLTLELDDETGEITVVIDKILSESRQQQLALKQLAGEIRAGGGAAKPATGGSILDQLAARRAQRRADPAS